MVFGTEEAKQRVEEGTTCDGFATDSCTRKASRAYKNQALCTGCYNDMAAHYAD